MNLNGKPGGVLYINSEVVWNSCEKFNDGVVRNGHRLYDLTQNGLIIGIQGPSTSNRLPDDGKSHCEASVKRLPIDCLPSHSILSRKTLTECRSGAWSLACFTGESVGIQTDFPLKFEFFNGKSVSFVF